MKRIQITHKAEISKTGKRLQDFSTKEHKDLPLKPREIRLLVHCDFHRPSLLGFLPLVFVDKRGQSRQGSSLKIVGVHFRSQISMKNSNHQSPGEFFLVKGKKKG